MPVPALLGGVLNALALGLVHLLAYHWKIEPNSGSILSVALFYRNGNPEPYNRFDSYHFRPL
jgi:hypothetical protein